MTIRSRMMGTALMLTLSMGMLAACGGSDAGSDDAEATSEATSSAAPTTDAEAESDEGTDGKPSKDDVVDGYTKLVTGSMGDSLPDDIVDKVVTCFVDELYDDASADTLQAIADSKPEGINPDDATLFTDASTSCTQKITGQ
ncbi:hypothetical protein [Aeromicrobium stalagmiti]|uniref:hypothetical protein n=1 Tax=Aeromicrobium stalagmiti TaxID=2738988 RepID=UPI0015680BFD|nr:hypothetical protein [Aeromicrobium stalagmiti]NRQ49289.1 hypothetical protein [Aeromicrobium stalagmiti]